jgi:hypothetical protein
MHNTLESHKLFPYVAWGLVIGFAVFTYMLTVNVQRELGNIGDGVERLEARLNEMETERAQ